MDSSDEEKEKPPITLVKPSLKEYTTPITPKMEEKARKWKVRIEAYEASLTAPPLEITKGTRRSMAGKTIPLTMTEFEPIVAWVRAPPALVVHQERTLTPAMLMKTIMRAVLGL